MYVLTDVISAFHKYPIRGNERRYLSPFLRHRNVLPGTHVDKNPVCNVVVTQNFKNCQNTGTAIYQK